MRAPWLFLLLGVLSLGSCRHAVEHGTVVDQLEHDEFGEPTDFRLDEPQYATVIVESGGVETFHTTARADSLVKFPCTGCHNVPLETLSSPAPAHQDIILEHAGPESMACGTCHATDNLDQLHTLTGQPIEYDRSYELCAQCHSTQFSDWEGGAHGKRLEGWAPPRTVENCVACHNPHAPGFEMRWPAVTSSGVNE